MKSASRAGALAALCVSLVCGGQVSRAQIPAASATPTFSRDVAPILYKNCVGCHRPGEIAPMPFTSYAETRPWTQAIRRAVSSRAMPPWGADPAIGSFANDPSLSARDVATLVAWADGGALEGNPNDLPALPPAQQGWKIGTPDVTIRMAGNFEVPASGPRIITDVPIEKATFDEDKYVEMMEIVPGNRTVTHHAVVSVVEGGSSQRIGGFQPGGAITTYPRGYVRKIPKGSSLSLNMHYNPKGEVATDRTTIALVFARGPIEKVVHTSVTSTRDLDIPPGAANYEAKGRPYVFAQDAHLVSLLPRMNERGKDITYTLVFPDGRSQTLLSVPRFNDQWQPSYVFTTPVAVPKGSRLEAVAHYDNSANNKRNPDPSQRVIFGPEILNAYFDYTLDGEGRNTN